MAIRGIQMTEPGQRRQVDHCRGAPRERKGTGPRPDLTENLWLSLWLSAAPSLGEPGSLGAWLPSTWLSLRVRPLGCVTQRCHPPQSGFRARVLRVADPTNMFPFHQAVDGVYFFVVM